MNTRYLEEIKKRLMGLAEPNSSIIGNDWVHVTMCLFRQHLEELNIKPNYPALNFYCDWIVHANLNKRFTQELLQRMSEKMNDNTSGNPSDRFSEILFAGLLDDIRTVLKTGGFESGIFQVYPDWKTFVALMLPLLIRKPLQWNSKIPDTRYIESFELHDNDGHASWEIKTQPGSHRFNGPLMFTFNPKDFSKESPVYGKNIS